MLKLILLSILGILLGGFLAMVVIFTLWIAIENKDKGNKADE